MADFRIIGATSDYLDFLPLDAEFDIDGPDSTEEDIGVDLGTDNMLIGVSLTETNHDSIGFNDDLDVMFKASLDDQNGNIGGLHIKDFVRSSGGEGGTTNYNDLENKPSINDVVVEGSKSGFEYGLQNRLIPGHGINIRNDGVTIDVIDAVSIRQVIEEYGVSTSPALVPDVWTPYVPATPDGSYLWAKTTIDYTNDEIPDTVSYTYSKQGADGTDGRDGEDGVVLRINSSRGNVFKHNQVNTVLTVNIHSGPDLITNITDLRAKFGSGAYIQWLWQRMNETTYGVIISTDSRISDDGFTFTLTPDDVDTKVTFMCQLII